MPAARSTPSRWALSSWTRRQPFKSSGRTPGSTRQPSALPPRASSPPRVSVLADGQDSPTTGQVAAARRPQVDRLRLQPGELRSQRVADRDDLQLGPLLHPGSQGRDGRHLEEPLLVRQPRRPASLIMAPFGKSVAQATRDSDPRQGARDHQGHLRPVHGPDLRPRTARSSSRRASPSRVMQKYSITWFVKGVIGNPKG